MLRRIVLTLLAPLLAIGLALGITSLILLITGDDVGGFFRVLTDIPRSYSFSCDSPSLDDLAACKSAARNVVNILNNGAVVYLSALAAAIGFRMNLFNIGVEGQYRMAVFFAAAFAGADLLPGALNVVVAILLAMAVGALWASIPAILKVTRGVSEVISTIMLNAIAVSITAYLLRKWGETTGTNLATKPVPGDAQVGGLGWVPEASNEIFGLALIAVVAGLAYAVLLNYTRFGFALRATGRSASAAAASGIDTRRMIITSMLVSGAVAGLIGLPLLFGTAPYSYGTTFQTGIGFAGIAVALLGRNNALGMVFGALLFAYLDAHADRLQIQAQISHNIVEVTKGVMVLSVVIAYEIIRRYLAVAEQRRVAAELRAEAPPPPAAEAPAKVLA